MDLLLYDSLLGQLTHHVALIKYLLLASLLFLVLRSLENQGVLLLNLLQLDSFVGHFLLSLQIGTPFLFSRLCFLLDMPQVLTFDACLLLLLLDHDGFLLLHFGRLNLGLLYLALNSLLEFTNLLLALDGAL